MNNQDEKKENDTAVTGKNAGAAGANQFDPLQGLGAEEDTRPAKNDKEELKRTEKEVEEEPKNDEEVIKK